MDPKTLNIILVNNDELENKVKDFLEKISSKLPLFIKDIILNSQEEWSTNDKKQIKLGLLYNKTPQDVMCLWIHEQLHSWEPTRKSEWLQYVKDNYQNRDMDSKMNQFTDDIDSCFAQHLVVIWNAFNITKQYYPNYIKPDVAYIIFQKFIRDNWKRIKTDLEKFDLIYSNDIKGGKKHKKHHKKISNNENVTSDMNVVSNENVTSDMNVVSNENVTDSVSNVNGGSQKEGYVCRCAFSRNKGVKDYTCLVDSELNRLRSIIKQPSKNIYDFYLQLIQNYKCSQADGVDQCVKKSLVQEYGEQVEQAFTNALPLENQISDLKQWLSSSNIDLLSYQLETNHPTFKYMGIATWDMFEDSLQDKTNSLNPQYIMSTIKKNPTKIAFGWVLNQCHKFSSGQHWVALGIVRQNKNDIKIFYYDSQSKEGPETGIISCDIRPGVQLNNEQMNKYKNYQSKFPEWWSRLVTIAEENQININKDIIHNTFITQSDNDNYSCGYHAFYFLFLITTEKNKTINALNLQIMSTQTKYLDDFMKEFQQKVFELK